MVLIMKSADLKNRKDFMTTVSLSLFIHDQITHPTETPFRPALDMLPASPVPSI